METPTITNISKKRNEIKESLRRVRTHDFGGSRYGAEQEFTEKSVIAGIEAILIDAGALCGAPAKFIKMSTSQERALLSNLFDQLLDHCNNLDLGSAVLVLEQIKPVFRAMGVRGSDDRRVALGFTPLTRTLPRRGILCRRGVYDKANEIQPRVQA